MTPEARVSEWTKWVAADLRPRQWGHRDSFVEALSEEREASAAIAEETAARYPGDPSDLKALAAFVAAAIRNRAA